MIVPASIRRRYERVASVLDTIERDVWETVSTFCRREGYAVTGRRKELSSLAEKLETGRYSKWSEIDDLYACKIIVPTLDEEHRTIAFLQRAFEVVETRHRGSTEKSPEVFRFDATRLICRLVDTGEHDRTEASKVLFEVQVVTAFEHAWSTTTHALAYKTGELNWGTKRLAAQLRAAIEQLDMLVLEAPTVAERLGTSPYHRLDEQRILLDGFQSLTQRGIIPDELTPSSWSRFAENIHRLRVQPTEILDACTGRAAGFHSDKFPRLVSLYQFALGSLLEARPDINLPRDYTPLITDEVLQIFPTLERWTGIRLED